MKNMVSHIRVPAVLLLLVMAVLLTMPSTVTGSKYVWEDSIDITLKVETSASGFASPDSEGEPLEIGVQGLTNIQATPTEDGLILKAEDGYTLPECVTVEMGSETFSVQTDGTQGQDGIAFDPETGLLSIADDCMETNPGEVTVSAVAVPETP